MRWKKLFVRREISFQATSAMTLRDSPAFRISLSSFEIQWTLLQGQGSDRSLARVGRVAFGLWSVRKSALSSRAEVGANHLLRILERCSNLVVILRSSIFQQFILVLRKVVLEQVEETLVGLLRDSRVLNNESPVTNQSFCGLRMNILISIPCLC